MCQLEYIQILYAFHFDSLPKNEHETRARLLSRSLEFSKRQNENYFLRFFSRVRSSFIDIVGSFLLSSINFQKVEEVCSTTCSQSFPSTPIITGAGLPRRVMTTWPCWDISTHSLIFF